MKILKEIDDDGFYFVSLSCSTVFVLCLLYVCCVFVVCLLCVCCPFPAVALSQRLLLCKSLLLLCLVVVLVCLPHLVFDVFSRLLLSQRLSCVRLLHSAIFFVSLLSV
jgi:hypothetical protein